MPLVLGKIMAYCHPIFLIQTLMHGLFRLEDEAAEKEAIKNMIKDLHEYNEIKDLAQILIGKIAQLEGTTTRGLYPKFGLELDD